MPQSLTDTPSCYIYAPTLHRELAPQGIPESVSFLFPGLSGTPRPVHSYTPENFPLDPARAVAVLRELLLLGESLEHNTETAALHNRALGQTENADLAAFAFCGGKASPAVQEEKAPSRIDAHKVLLLVWDLEERLMELETLRQQVRNAAKPLGENLREPSMPQEHGISGNACAPKPEIDLQDALESFLDMPDVAVPEPDWRTVLAAMSAFLPDNAVLVTANPDMVHALTSWNEEKPFPGYCRDISLDVPSPLTFVGRISNTPLREIIRYAKPEAQTPPWLNRSPNIILLREEKKP